MNPQAGANRIVKNCRLLIVFRQFILLSVVCLFSFPLQAGIADLLPKPQQIASTGDRFYMGKISLSTPVMGEEWTQWITDRGGVLSDRSSHRIIIRLVEKIEEATVNTNEAYRLSVTNHVLVVEATSEQGVYWAMQTLSQLTVRNGNKTYIEGCCITDWPAFRIRGFMHDAGRSYISIDELKREVAALSHYKINVFHWHLTENQAWRLESRIFPMLNDSSNMLRMPGKYYTLEEAKEFTEYCKKHHVMLIPEIDMPGHSAAFVRAFRHEMQSREGTAILKLLLDEVCETFDVPYIHIGTDEVEFLNPGFVPEMVEYIRSKGKKVISWNPGWNYRPGEIDMTQLWSYRGKPQPGIPAVDSRFHYANHFDVFADLVGLFFSRIADQEQGSPDIAGSVIAFWNDRLVQPEGQILLQNGFYPYTLTLAERTWRGGGWGYFDNNCIMLPDEHSDAFRNFSEFEDRLLRQKKQTLKNFPFPYVKQTNVKWNITDAFPNEGDLIRKFPPEDTISNSYFYEGQIYKVRQVTGAGIYLRHVWGKSIPAFYPDPQSDHTAYAYTWVFSEKRQEAGLWVEFQNYGRSESDLPPPPGKWDYKESRIWMNDKEILPPVWTATHTVRDNEIPLGNENMAARAPIRVSLNKGWNKLLLKLPVGKFSTPEVRLVKWMFAAVLVTPDGSEALPRIIYSPDKRIQTD